MESKTAMEVAIHLFSIFLIFGASNILQSDNSREFVNSVLEELRFIWSECIINQVYMDTFGTHKVKEIMRGLIKIMSIIY